MLAGGEADVGGSRRCGREAGCSPVVDQELAVDRQPRSAFGERVELELAEVVPTFFTGSRN
jgi:hypothetical protein